MNTFDLLIKTNRHDFSMTEKEKKQFRSSTVWQDHRLKIFNNQKGLDYITNEPLQDDWNCHHIIMKNTEYTKLDNPFVALNYNIHKKVHDLFNSYFDDKQGWQEFKDTHGYKDSRMLRLYEVLEKMFALNDDIEPVLYQNRIEYTLVDSQNKFRNFELARQYKYPVNDKGYLQWNHNYIPAEYPQDSVAWIQYMAKINNTKDKNTILLLLELRHVNLYSSYKNFRNNPKIRQETKRACRKELEKTTEMIRKYFI